MATPPLPPIFLTLARGAAALNTLGNKPILKIHPATGIARLG